jgi:methionine-rich copper-binding protein CopC
MFSSGTQFMTRSDNLFATNQLLYMAIIASLAFPQTSFAHAIMVKSQPEADSTIADSPKQVDTWFNDKVGSEYKALAVINSAGQRVDNKDATQETFDHSHLYTTVSDLPPDTYTVRYRVVSMDTHIVTGKFKFTIKKP